MNTAISRALPTDQLLTRAATGDQRAFAELYDRMAPRVLGLAVRLIIDRSIAEEVMQEVFLEAWQHAARFDPTRGAAVPWLLSLARTRSIDRIRSEQSARDRLIRVGIRDYEHVTPDAADDLERADQGRRAMAGLRGLSDRQREAVSLFYAGHTHREISEHLGVPVNTIKTRVRDGLAKLRLELGVESDGGSDGEAGRHVRLELAA